MTAKRLKASIRAWLPVASLACGTFIFNTSEFIPIGLLSSISSDFAMSEAATGMIITIYAWVVALASLPLMLFFSQHELKTLMMGVLGVFVASHIVSAFASSFYMLCASRIGVAFAHSLFWSIVTPMAVRAAPRGKRSAAISIVVTGSSLAIVAGLPLGRIVGLYFDWRTTFAGIGVVAFAVLLLFWRVFKTMPNTQTITLRTLPTLAKNKHFRRICILVALFITGNFTAYSYIEPYLLGRGFESGMITTLLALFGVSGIAASVLFGKFYDTHHAVFVNFSLFGVIVGLLLYQAAAFSVPSFLLLCVFWGVSITCFNVVFQSQVLAAVPQASAIAMSIYSGIYNVGIGGGAFVGGFVVEHFGVGFVGFVGAGFAGLACFYFVRKVTLLKIVRRKVKQRAVKRGLNEDLKNAKKSLKGTLKETKTK